MARHNRDGKGTDQRGYEYVVSYQPDWLSQVKVTRTLRSGRQSTKTLFRNPGEREQSPGQKIRTRISSADQGLSFELTVDDSKGTVSRVVVETRPEAAPEQEPITFTIESDLPSASGRG